MASRAMAASAARSLLPIDAADDLDIDSRLAAGDRVGLYDAIRECQAELDRVADDVDYVLSSGRHMRALMEARLRKEEALRMDAQRNGATLESQ